jgi:hypothetical protein
VNPLAAATAIEAAAGAHIPAVAPRQVESSVDPKLDGLGAAGAETDDGSLVVASAPLAEDSRGWACSPKSGRSNHGRLREACNLHCKYISQTGIFLDLADSSSSIGVPSGEEGAHGSSNDSFSSPGEPTCAHTQIEGGDNCENQMLEQKTQVVGDTLIPHNTDSGALAEQTVLIAKHLGSPVKNDKAFTKTESNRNERQRRGPKARMMALGKPLPRKACMIRPWRGPLPWPRSAA